MGEKNVTSYTSHCLQVPQKYRTPGTAHGSLMESKMKLFLSLLDPLTWSD
jgi:hypothetical protein